MHVCLCVYMRVTYAQVLNAVSLPVVLFFLFRLSTRDGVLPPEHRLRGWYAVFVGFMFVVVSLVACVAALAFPFAN